MARIVIELTNRCNLHCQHCFAGRHGGSDDLRLDIFCRILNEARASGFDHLSFTGGEPTLHPRFEEVLRLTYKAGYKFGLVTNGWSLAAIYQRILPYRERLDVITLSLDGATEETHDWLRGKGSYRAVMRAASVCVFEGIPFTINMVVTTRNRHEIQDMARLAIQLGSQGLRYGHLMPVPMISRHGLDLSPGERKAVESEIWDIQKQYSFPIAMAPGYYTTHLFPCAALQMQELNIDYHGNIGRCCHLSGHGDGMGQGDIAGNFSDMSLAEAYDRLVEENERFHDAKMKHLSCGGFMDSDFFPCWYCSLYYRKLDWLKKLKWHPWSGLMWESPYVFMGHPTSTSNPVEAPIVVQREV